MARFEDSIGYVLANEGGFADHPADPGGVTYWGISLRYLKGKGELGDIDGDGDIDADDVRSLTKADAIEFYRKDFWDKLKLEKLKADAVAQRTFDMSVNMGLKAATKILQQAVNSVLPKDATKLKVDGKLGPKTRAATNKFTARTKVVKLMGALRSHHAAFYRSLVEQNPALKVFLVGWLRRANK